MEKNPERDWFGDTFVGPDVKTGLVKGVFDSVFSKYDLMNDVMSGGLHRVWKDIFIAQHVRPRAGKVYLDVAGGTGDIAFRIRKKTKGEAKIIVCDINENMLHAGRDRSIDRGWLDLDWVTGDAENIPLPDSSVDTYTISFGLRNVTHIDAALEEACRVLKPGGMFFCMEFGHVKDELLAGAYEMYSQHVIPAMGEMFASDRESYQYLVESIRRFPPQEELAERMEKAGFKRVGWSDLSGGIVAVHRGAVPA